MFTVYILYSARFKKTYVGFTSNLEARLLSHNQLATKGYTIRYRPWALVYSEAFTQKSEAIEKEKFFKSGKGRTFIKLLIRDLYPEK